MSSDSGGMWERRNGGLFMFPHVSMREAMAALPEVESDSESSASVPEEPS